MDKNGLTYRRGRYRPFKINQIKFLFQFENKKPIGIMLNATTNEDDYLLRISSEIEKILEK